MNALLASRSDIELRSRNFALIVSKVLASHAGLPQDLHAVHPKEAMSQINRMLRTGVVVQTGAAAASEDHLRRSAQRL